MNSGAMNTNKHPLPPFGAFRDWLNHFDRIVELYKEGLPLILVLDILNIDPSSSKVINIGVNPLFPLDDLMTLSYNEMKIKTD